MPRDPRILLDDIRECLRRIESYTNGVRGEALQDPRTLDAVIRNLEVIGEAAKQLPVEALARHEEIDWRKIAGLRDILIHQYFGIDVSILADVVSTKLPDLKASLQEE